MADDDYKVEGIGDSARPEYFMNHEVVVFAQISRILDEVSDLHNEFRKVPPSFIRTMVDDFAAESAKRVRTTMGETKRLLHMSTWLIEDQARMTYLSAGLALQSLF